MKRKHSIYLLLILFGLSIVINKLAYHTYFSLAFDARDNYWPFARYYLTIYPDEIKFMLLTVLALFIGIFTKNITMQTNGRNLMIVANYLIKFILGLALIHSLSSMHVITYLNDFKALLPVAALIIPTTISLCALIFIVIIREIFTKIKSINYKQFRSSTK